MPKINLIPYQMKLKKILLIVLALIFPVYAFAQFKLSGKIKGYTGQGKLEVNIPLVYGFYKENSITIPIAKDGSFSIAIPLQTQKFANLIYLRTFHTLLLSPGKNLSIELRPDSTLKPLAGTALAENKVLTEVDLEEYPFFLAKEGQNRYGQLNLAQVKEQVAKRYFAQRDEKIKKVMTAPLTSKNKQLIASELKYIAYNYLNDLARVQMKNKPVIDSLIIDLFDQSNNKPDVFPAGPQYYAFADNYLRYLETKAFVQIRKENIPPSQPIPYYGISLDSANVLVKKYGKPYWRWVGSTHNLPLNVTEVYTYQEITKLSSSKDLNQAEALANAFKAQFATSRYTKAIDAQLATLKQLLAQNQNNEKIQIFKGYEQSSSIYDIIKTQKGKVVYLDIWGTWCGPCKDELYHLPNLKARFKDKDVVFVYLDMDEDEREAIWQEHIKISAMTGVHLRKNRQTIQPFWNELLADVADKSQSYPRYFIFDKAGKLAIPNALRPSQGDELYQQIEGVLNQK